MEMGGSRFEESDGVAVVPFLVLLPGKKLRKEKLRSLLFQLSFWGNKRHPGFNFNFLNLKTFISQKSPKKTKRDIKLEAHLWFTLNAKARETQVLQQQTVTPLQALNPVPDGSIHQFHPEISDAGPSKLDPSII